MNQILVCDLDDCLIRTDALYEQWILLLKKKPLLFFQSFFWLLKGKAYFKSQIATHTPFHPDLLPYRKEVLDLIKNFRTEQRGQVVLASASPFAWIQAISNHLEIFDDAIGSDEKNNRRGEAKLSAIREKIGSKSFAYIGDHADDLAIWKEAAEVIAVNPNRSVRTAIEKLNKPTKLIEDRKNPLRFVVKQLRPHQWVKNTLIFLPALAGHKLFQGTTFIECIFAFAGFSLSASFVYILNDLLDLHSDRNHMTKKNRPFASGNLSVKWGLILLPLLLVGVISFASHLPINFGGWIATYFILNIAYSFYLKQAVIVDIIILSMMYTLRIFAGSAATEIPISEWLLSFSTLFFFSLACIKRYTEIVRSKTKLTIDGRGYRQMDYPVIQTLGAGSGLLSILIILLYLQSSDVRALYRTPENLWYATPVLLFWVSRIWLLTSRDEVHDDPVVFAVKDRVSWFCLVLISAILGISI